MNDIEKTNLQNLSGESFVASMSGGKDSSQSIWRAIQMGLKPKFFFTTFDSEKERNYFHGMTREMIAEVSKVVDIPIYTVETSSKGYAKDFVSILIKAREQGVKYCVFGDIDIAEHRQWGEERCREANMTAIYPLWQEKREAVVKNFVQGGFKSVVTVCDNNALTDDILGEKVDLAFIDRLKNAGVDPCGERGEYHTFTYYAPYFSREIEFTLSNVHHHENYAYRIIDLKK